MSNYSFADHYKSAGLTPGPEIIGLRQEPFDTLREDINLPILLDLTRLYFGLPLSDGTDWFRDAFAETDSSFSMVDNEREASVLASCLLAAALEDGYVWAALIPVIATAGGVRQPLIRPEFIEEARLALVQYSISSQSQQAVDLNKIKQPKKSTIEASVTEFLTQPDWPKAGECFKLAGSESSLAVKNLANQVKSVISPLVEQMQDLRGEINMLWWYIGGWSRVLEKPFTELTPGLAALMAGLDLAHLALEENGPAAAPAILQRLVVDSRVEGGNEKLDLASAVDELPSGTFQQLDIPASIDNVADLCPVLTAMAKADQIGTGDRWHEAFKKASGLEATTSFLPLDLAMQIYRESLLLSQID